MKTLATVLACAALVVGCATATSGTDFNGAGLSTIKPGISTLQEVSLALGRAPNSSATGPTGATNHTWQFIRSSAQAGFISTKVETSIKQAVLVFNADGTFVRVGHLSGIDLAPDDRTRLFATRAAAGR